MPSTAQINPTYEVMGADTILSTNFLFPVQTAVKANFLEGIRVMRMTQQQVHNIVHFGSPAIELIPVSDCKPHALEAVKSQTAELRIMVKQPIYTYNQCQLLGVQGVKLQVGELNTGNINEYLTAILSGVNAQYVNNLYLDFVAELWFGQTKTASATTPILSAKALNIQGLLPRIIEQDNGAGVMVVDDNWSASALTAGAAKAKFDELIASNEIFESVALGNGNGVTLRCHTTLAVYKNLIESLVGTTVNTVNLLPATITANLNDTYMYNGILIQAHPEWDKMYTTGTNKNIMLMTLESESPLYMGMLDGAFSNNVINMTTIPHYNHIDKQYAIDYRFWYGLGTQVVNGSTSVRLAY